MSVAIPQVAVLGQVSALAAEARGDLHSVQFLGQGDIPVVVPSGAFGQTAQKTVDFLQLPFIAGRRHPGHGAMADSHGFKILKTIVTPLLSIFMVVDALLCRSCLLCPLLLRAGAHGFDSAVLS